MKQIRIVTNDRPGILAELTEDMASVGADKGRGRPSNGARP